MIELIYSRITIPRYRIECGRCPILKQMAYHNIQIFQLRFVKYHIAGIFTRESLLSQAIIIKGNVHSICFMHTSKVLISFNMQ